MGVLNALAFFSFFVSSFAASANDWSSRSIYQVSNLLVVSPFSCSSRGHQLVTDRFALANGSGPACDTANRKYCGGNYQGIISHLDYIQNMGFDAIWISPVVSNFEGASAYGEAYHGFVPRLHNDKSAWKVAHRPYSRYWPVDLFSLNPHFGTGEDLNALADALHKRSMYLMVDVVVNHFASKDSNPLYASFIPFNQESDFHAKCFITDYNNQTDVEQCWLGDNNVPLVDVNTENDAIVSTYNNWIKSLVANHSVDGVRIDTVKHIRKDFWPNFASSSGVYSIGEVYHGDTQYVAAYTRQLILLPTMLRSLSPIRGPKCRP